MELDDLRNSWTKQPTPALNTEDIRKSMSETSRPVVKKMLNKLLIESIAFSLMGVFYYGAFDGDQKPVLLNLLLITALLLLVSHHLILYILTKNVILKTDLKSNLLASYQRLRTHAMISLCIRMLTAVCILCFFGSVITWNSSKLVKLGMIIVFMIAAIWYDHDLWMRKLKKLKEVIQDLSAGNEKK
ncbi:MAG: hypothetical protein ABW007_15405 [Chitinophagaceae bacterium]